MSETWTFEALRQELFEKLPADMRFEVLRNPEGELARMLKEEAQKWARARRELLRTES
jgi:hypothetical protein